MNTTKSKMVCFIMMVLFFFFCFDSSNHFSKHEKKAFVVVKVSLNDRIHVCTVYLGTFDQLWAERGLTRTLKNRYVFKWDF